MTYLLWLVVVIAACAISTCIGVKLNAKLSKNDVKE